MPRDIERIRPPSHPGNPGQEICGFGHGARQRYPRTNVPNVPMSTRKDVAAIRACRIIPHSLRSVRTYGCEVVNARWAVLLSYGVDIRSGLPVAKSTGTEKCSWTMSHRPPILRYPSVVRRVNSMFWP